MFVCGCFLLAADAVDANATGLQWDIIPKNGENGIHILEKDYKDFHLCLQRVLFDPFNFPDAYVGNSAFSVWQSLSMCERAFEHLVVEHLALEHLAFEHLAFEHLSIWHLSIWHLSI